MPVIHTEKEAKKPKEVIKPEWPRAKVKQLKEEAGEGPLVKFQDESALNKSGAETAISADKCLSGIRRFLTERNSVIVLGLDEELQQMYRKKPVKPVKEEKEVTINPETPKQNSEFMPKADDNSVCHSSIETRMDDFETISLDAN